MLRNEISKRKRQKRWKLPQKKGYILVICFDGTLEQGVISKPTETLFESGKGLF